MLNLPSDMTIIPSSGMASFSRREWISEPKIIVIVIDGRHGNKGRGILGEAEHSFGREMLNQYRGGGRIESIIDMHDVTTRFGTDPMLDITMWSRDELERSMSCEQFKDCEHFVLKPRLDAIERFARIASTFMVPITSTMHKARMDRIDQNMLPGRSIRRLKEAMRPQRMAYPLCNSPLDLWMPPEGDLQEFIEEKKPMTQMLEDLLRDGRVGSAYRDAAIYACSHAAMLGRTRRGAEAIVDMAEKFIRKYWATHSRAPFSMMMRNAIHDLKRVGSHRPYEGQGFLNAEQKRYVEIRDMTRIRYDEALLPLVVDLEENMVIVRVKLKPSSPTLKVIGVCMIGDEDRDPSSHRIRPVLLPSV
jgi:hypothetical protein